MASIEFKKRLGWIDQYRGLLFFFVIVFHTFQSPVWLRYFFDFFFLPGFFLLSGFLFKPKGIRTNLLNILNSLLIPYFIFSLIISIYTTISHKEISSFFETFTDYFVLGGDGIWFIPCLIVLEVMFTLVSNWFKKKDNLIFISMFSLIISYFIVDGSSHHLPWNIDTAVISLPFFTIGYLLKDVSGLSKAMTCSLFVFYLILSQLIGNSLYYNIDVDLHNNVIGNPFVYVVLSVLASYALMELCKISTVLWYFRKLGQYTLFAFPFHPYAYRTVVKLLAIIIPAEGELNLFCTLVVAPFITGLLMIFSGIILEKYAPYVIGKYKYINFDFAKK